MSFELKYFNSKDIEIIYYFLNLNSKCNVNDNNMVL